jgi:hypothetical protein
MKHRWTGLLLCITISFSSCFTNDLSNIEEKFGYYNAINIVFVSKTDSSYLYEVDDMNMTGFKLLEEDSNFVQPILQIKRVSQGFLGYENTDVNFMVLPLKPGNTSTFVIYGAGNDIDTLKISHTLSAYFDADLEDYRPDYNNVKVEINSDTSLAYYGFDKHKNILYFKHFN